MMLLVAGCATHPPAPRQALRAFDFEQDTFCYANELVWEYHYDANGKWVSHPREPKPEYSHHCFVVARAALQFFYNARFDPGLPVASDAEYRKLIRKVALANPRHILREDRKIVIPGYATLRAFSMAQEKILKRECGVAAESYFQRGHWRMIFPFSRAEQAEMAAQLQRELEQKGPIVVHVVRFPQLTINHAILLFASRETPESIEFSAYDPNKPLKPAMITFDRSSRTFDLPANDYFPGGRVDVYEVYHAWDY